MKFWLKSYIDLFDTAHRHMPMVQAEHITWSPDGKAAVRLAGTMPVAKDALLSISEGHTLYVVYKCSGERDKFSSDGVIASLYVLKPPRFKFENIPALSPSEDEVVKMVVFLQCQLQMASEGNK